MHKQNLSFIKLVKMEGCLICGGGGPQPGIKYVPPTAATPPPHPLLSGGENFVIRDHLWAIFILRRFLQLPKETCERLLLRTFGLNPGGWFTLCETCSKVGHSAFRISAQILTLEKELEGLREETKVRLRRSLDEEEDIKSELLCVRQEIRGYFRETLQPFPTCEVDDVTSGSVYNVTVEKLPDDDQGSCVIKVEDHEGSDSVDSDPDYNPDPNHSDGGTAVSDDKEEEEDEEASMSSSPTRKKRSKRASGTPRGSSRRYGRPQQRNLIPRAEDKYKCDKCDFVAKYSDQFWSHLQKHKSKITDHIVKSGDSPKNTRFRCRICNKDFPLQGAAVQHLRDTHAAALGIKKTFRCTTCSRVFDQRNRLERHIKTVHLKEKQFYCDVCGAGYSQITDFEDHKAKHLNDGRGVFVCDICGAEMSSRRSLLEHQTKFHPSHQGGGGEDGAKKKCPQCDLQLLHTHALRLHLKAAHSDLYRYSCDSCDASYVRSNSLKIHKSAAHSAEKVKCPHCDKELGCSKYLTDHLARRCRKIPGKNS